MQANYYYMQLHGKLRRYLRRTKMAFREIDPQHHKFWLSNSRRCTYKTLEATFVNFSKAFDSILRGKMEQTLLTYGLLKETVAAIMMLYRNTKVKVCSSIGDTDYFDIIAGLLQGDTLAPYLFIICLDYMLRMSIDKMNDNGFKLTKERSRRYLAQTIMDVDYADDIAHLANTSAQVKILLHTLDWAAIGISLHVNTNKTQSLVLESNNWDHLTV